MAGIFTVVETILLFYCCALPFGATPIFAVKVLVHEVGPEATQQGQPSDVYWSEDVEKRLQAPFNEEHRKTFVAKVHTQRITKLQTGCGRLKNRLATLEDGSKVCCRFRDRNELRGDLYSYFFNSLLGLWNVPPTTMLTLDLSSEQWNGVASEVAEAGWEDGSDILMVLYVEDLQGEYIPDLLRPGKALLTQDSVLNFTQPEQLRLIQWTDMIIFDFIIGHTDRLFNTLLNHQWNSHMLERCVHNLEKTQSGKLILIDNESGFWVGYASAEWKQANYDYQIHFLKELCLFRRRTVQTLMQLCESRRADTLLEDYMKETDFASFSAVRKLKPKERTDFKKRLETVKERILQCS